MFHNPGTDMDNNAEDLRSSQEDENQRQEYAS